MSETTVLKVEGMPLDLLRRVKAKAAMQGMTLRSVAIEALNQWLSSSPDVSEEAADSAYMKALEQAWPKGDKPDHNPKTCRIYGCLACQVKKEKP